MTATTDVYARLPVLLQHAAVAAYGWRMHRLRRGGVWAATRQSLARSERLSAPDLREIQRSELQRVVRHAVSSCPYYASLFKELGLDPSHIRDPDDLRRLPLLEKTTLFERADDVRAHAVPHTRMYFTSGTSGTTLALPIDDASRQRNYAFFDRALSWAGVENGRSATFAGRPVVPARLRQPRIVWRWNPALQDRIFSSYHISEANAPVYARALRRWAPDFIDSYPSAVAALAVLFSDLQLEPPRPRAIVTSAETLTTEDRERIERVFGAPCFDQYGCTEQAALVSQCEFGAYHVHPEFGIVEVLKDDGEPARPGECGQLVCTSFTNDAFPLLRYRIGDVAVSGTPGCRCGRWFPVLHEIVGRTDDLLVTPDGRRVGRLDPVFKGRRSIREAQIVQESTADVRVRLVPATGYTDADGEAVAREIAARLGPDMRVFIERVASIERTRAGKFRAVVNRATKGGGAAGE